MAELFLSVLWVFSHLCLNALFHSLLCKYFLRTLIHSATGLLFPSVTDIYVASTTPSRSMCRGDSFPLNFEHASVTVIRERRTNISSYLRPFYRFPSSAGSQRERQIPTFHNFTSSLMFQGHMVRLKATKVAIQSYNGQLVITLEALLESLS